MLHWGCPQEKRQSGLCLLSKPKTFNVSLQQQRIVEDCWGVQDVSGQPEFDTVPSANFPSRCCCLFLGFWVHRQHQFACLQTSLTKLVPRSVLIHRFKRRQRTVIYPHNCFTVRWPDFWNENRGHFNEAVKNLPKKQTNKHTKKTCQFTWNK